MASPGTKVIYGMAGRNPADGDDLRLYVRLRISITLVSGPDEHRRCAVWEGVSKVNTMDLADERYVSITTFKRDGTPVSTPVWCVGEDGSLLVLSEADSWKVKRIRNDPHVCISPCSARGTPRGVPLDAEASLFEDTTEVESLLAHKYGWVWRGYTFLAAANRRLRRQAVPKAVTIRMTARSGLSDGVDHGQPDR